MTPSTNPKNGKNPLAPTSVKRAAKESLVDALRTVLQDAKLIVVFQQSGLSADQTRALRIATRQAGVHLRVAKNTLARLALIGTPAEGLGDSLKGPTVLAFSEDPVAAAKVIATFGKDAKESIKIVGAALNGQILDAVGTMALATLPSLDELRGKLVGLLVAPATRVACVLAAPAGQLARVCAARGRQES